MVRICTASFNAAFCPYIVLALHTDYLCKQLQSVGLSKGRTYVLLAVLLESYVCVCVFVYICMCIYMYVCTVDIF